MDCKLGGEVLKRVKAMRGIEAALVFTVAAFDLAVVPGSVGANAFVADA